MITASERAVEELKDGLIRKFLNEGLGYRIISHTYESGNATFSMELDKERSDDEVVASHGIRILLDPASAALLKDYELDYLDGPTGGFYLKNEKAAGDSQVRAKTHHSEILSKRR